MDSFLGRYKNLIVLAAILFAQIIGLALQVRRPAQAGDTRLLRVWAIGAVTPIESAVVHTQKWIYDIWHTYAYLRGVRRENRALRAEIAQMKIENARFAEDAQMARRIQALLAFKEQYVDTTIAAQVIGTSGSEQSRILYLDKGSKDGIKPDMAVITPGGIVGKIVQVFPDSSQVLPINDQFSGVGAALKSSRLQGILKGSTSGVTTLQYIMSDEKVEPGEEVITSGGDRIFPKGLPVGKVVAVEPGKDLFLNIRVVPSAHLDRLEEVLVVTRILEKQPDTKDLGPLRASDILAERLPTVPNKAEVDAAGNAKPGAATGATPGTTPPPGTAAGGRPPAAAGGASTSKPAVGTAATATKPGGTATTTPGTAAGSTAGVSKAPKPVTAGGTRPAGGAKPPIAGTATQPNAATTASPSPANAPASGDEAAPAPKQTKPVEQTKPAPEPTQNAAPDQSSTPPPASPPQP